MQSIEEIFDQRSSYKPSKTQKFGQVSNFCSQETKSSQGLQSQNSFVYNYEKPKGANQIPGSDDILSQIFCKIKKVDSQILDNVDLSFPKQVSEQLKLWHRKYEIVSEGTKLITSDLEISQLNEMKMKILEHTVKTFVPPRKLTVDQQIEILKSQCLDSDQKYCDINLIAIQDQKLIEMWIEYIGGCKNRIDLYEYALENSIGSFSSQFVINFAQFLEKDGDFNPEMQYQASIFDFRYALKVYKDALSRFEKLENHLRDFLQQVQKSQMYSDSTRAEIESNIKDLMSKYRHQRQMVENGWSFFVKTVEDRKHNEFPERFAECKKLKKLKKQRNFKDAKLISEKHNKLYSKIPRETGSHHIFMPNSNYTIFVDEDLLEEGAIEKDSQTIERFYEALDELDQYDLGLQNSANFFIKEIEDRNQKIQVERVSMRESFLEKQKWKVVNPTKKLFQNDLAKIEFSEKRKSRANQISNELSDFYDSKQEDQLDFLLDDIPEKKEVSKRKSKMQYGSTKLQAATKVKTLDFSKQSRLSIILEAQSDGLTSKREPFSQISQNNSQQSERLGMLSSNQSQSKQISSLCDKGLQLKNPKSVVPKRQDRIDWDPLHCLVSQSANSSKNCNLSEQLSQSIILD